MRYRQLPTKGILFLLTLSIFAAPLSYAQYSSAENSKRVSTATTETVLYSFTARNDGFAPLGGLASDAAGDLYGTTEGGGAYDDGTVFKLTPNSGGGWTESVLYTFTGGDDGRYPAGGVIVDVAGNLFGTTAEAGAHSDGTVFELTPASGGGWTFNTIHTFAGPDGANSYAGLIFDAAGNLYGTTRYGGAHGIGAVFELKPQPDGAWNESVLHSFADGRDQGLPMGPLVFDKAGNLYGTNIGVYGYGVVFELTRQSSGRWTISVLEDFNGAGGYPQGALILDSAGNLYGTTYEGGRGYGTVFELQKTSGALWKLDILWNFSGGADGGYPVSALSLGASGNLYGVAPTGGANGAGVVYEVYRQGGAWVEDVLYNFTGGTDGAMPTCLTLASGDTFYGTTEFGGADGSGTVFEITVP